MRLDAAPVPAIEMRGLVRRFGGGRTLFGREKPAVHALQGVDLDVAEGETLGVVGESGCGKSTLAKLIVGLDAPSEGTVAIHGEDVTGQGPQGSRAQYVFQDPIASLNPRKTIRQTLEAPMRRLLNLSERRREARLAELLNAVSLRSEFLERYPHEFSGGQAQRIGLARALAAEARIVVLDEPVSALDVSVQAQVLNLLARLRADYGLTYVFISHDLSVVESVSDRVAVMYFGRIVETGPARRLFRRPRHPYTDLLMRSAPAPGRSALQAEEKASELPDPLNPPPGCPFVPRCPRAVDRCRREHPPLEGPPGATVAACWRPLDG